MTDPRRALDAIGQLPDTEIDIAGAALQLARVDAPDADWLAAHEHLSELAQKAVALTVDIEPNNIADRAIALSGLLGGRYGYTGDMATYDDLANANLIRVIERRRGLPVALGVLWLHTARAAGWDGYGIDFPAHFLVALKGKTGQVVLDVFHGGTPLNATDLRTLLRRVQGEDAELRPGLLRPMSARRVLLRLQNNVMTRRLQGGDLEGGLACAEDMLRIAPDHADLWRHAAMLNQQLDRVSAALRCYERFLAQIPAGEAADRVRAAVDALRARLN